MANTKVRNPEQIAELYDKHVKNTESKYFIDVGASPKEMMRRVQATLGGVEESSLIETKDNLNPYEGLRAQKRPAKVVEASNEVTSSPSSRTWAGFWKRTTTKAPDKPQSEHRIGLHRSEKK